MNTYEVFLPLGLKDDPMTGAQATRLAQCLAYLLRGSKESFTRTGFDVQNTGGGDAAATSKGIILQFGTSLRLPATIDDKSVGRQGTLIGTPNNTNGPTARLTLVSEDNQAYTRMSNWLVPYAMRGDMVVYVSDDPLEQMLNNQTTFLPSGGAGLPGVYMGEVNSDSIDGVNQSPFSVAEGFALIGAPREAIRVGGEIINVNPTGITGPTRGRQLALKGAR